MTFFIQKKWLYILSIFLFLWLAGVFIAPLLAKSDNSFMFLTSDFLYFFYKLSCHQNPERCFHIAGGQLCVCVRCVAIYLAGIIIIGFYLTRRSIKLWAISKYALLTAPALIDFLLEKISIYQNQEYLRFITGAILGIALFQLIIVATSLSPVDLQRIKKHNKINS
jgi:uncharacterized membrane protein